VRFSELDGARIGVWGAGREITSLANQLGRRLPAARIAVAAFDEEPSEGTAELLASPGLQVAWGAAAVEALEGCEVIVRSPGVSIYKPELLALKARGIPVTTATSLWLAEHGPERVIVVTGTKGKSTTAALAHHLARAAGEPVRLAGNIGIPVLDLLDSEDGPTILELSSYQISDLAAGPEVAVLTNLFPEHADWHGSPEGYRSDKLRILSLAELRTAVLPARQPELAQLATGARRVLFGGPGGWDATEQGVSYAGEVRVRTAELALPGLHNALNLCAALSGLEAIGIAPPPLPAALAGFEGLEHRLQTVAEEPGLTWVDDSISTTPESTLAALASFPGRPIVLLAGGQDRGQDYGELGRRLALLDATVIGLPSTGARLLESMLAAGAPASRALAAADLEDGVRLARERAGTGAVVLLSPAAPSYDHYRDFTERGERFRALLGAP
jgi:UDP-N-acetylmuramoylalanine--D-glutamate ligase